MSVRIRTGSVELAFGTLVFALCLFGGCAGIRSSPWLGDVSAEVLAVVREPGTQWMIFLCCAVNLLALAAEWRWLNVGRGSPWFARSSWYPTMRLFRAPSFVFRFTEVTEVGAGFIHAALGGVAESSVPGVRIGQRLSAGLGFSFLAENACGGCCCGLLSAGPVPRAS